MKQYCRYCSHMICGDANYCEVRQRCFSNFTLKCANGCKDFDFNAIDALGINRNEYKPRGKWEIVDGEEIDWKQITWEDFLR